MKNFKNFQVRQGDVFLKEIKNVQGKKIGEKEMVLALGEVTGHKHILRGENVQFFDVGNGQVQVQVEKEALLSHDEHAAIEIPAGNYAVVIQRELNLLGEVQKVSD